MIKEQREQVRLEALARSTSVNGDTYPTSESTFRIEPVIAQKCRQLENKLVACNRRIRL